MPSPRNLRAARILVTVAIATCGGAASGLEPVAPMGPGVPPTVSQIEVAVNELKADPQLGTERKVRTLRWASEENPPPEAIPKWTLWLQGLVRWIAASVRMIVWVLAAILAAFIVIYVLRVLRTRVAEARGNSFIAPSHVRDLDIRPESLPSDIGAAALQLWERGEQRRALALLYRGLLSRMVHAHRAPVRDSTTEGECIQLARRCLPAAAGAFAATLVVTWQRAVYGGLLPATEQVRALCADFSASLDPPETGAAGT